MNDTALGNDRNDGRLSLLLSYLEQAQRNVPLLMDIVQQAVQEGQHDAALKACETLIALEAQGVAVPEAAAMMACEGRVMALRQLDDVDEALLRCDEALLRWPHSPWLLSCASALLFGAGRIDDATVRARDAAAHADDDRLLRDALPILAMSDLLMGEVVQSLAWADRAIELGNDGELTHYLRALAYLEMHRFQEALIDLERAVKLRPNYLDPWIVLAWLHHRHQALDKAADCAHRALMLSPANGDAHAVNAAILASRGERTAAEQALQRARRLDPHCAGLSCAQATIEGWPPEDMLIVVRQLRVAFGAGMASSD